MKRFRCAFWGSLACIFVLVFIISGEALGAAAEGEAQEALIAEIETLAASGEGSSGESHKNLVERIEAKAAAVTDALLPRLADAKAGERQLAIYVWALGVARDPRSVGPLISLSKTSASKWVRTNCYQALSLIEAREAGEFLYATLKTAKDKEERFVLLDQLAQMRYEAALSEAGEILGLDHKQYYWQSIFIFGKMGAKAVPFLIAKIDDPDANVRMNAINVLGIWLVAREAAQPLREHYWKEQDPEIRLLILNSLERVSPNLQAVKDFSTEVATKEKEASVVKFARETIDHVETMKRDLDAVKGLKKASPEAFASQYEQIFKSAGHEGDYGILSSASSWEDEPKLDRLRERVLQRNSDECFYDYQKINGIIIFNRLIQGRP